MPASQGAFGSRSVRTADSEGLRIAYDDAGRGSPAVVLIHGSFGNRTHYAAQFEHLARRHRVVALDLRGHGESEIPPSGFGMRDFAQDVIAVCEAAGIDRAVVCSHSWPLALEVAAIRPDLAAGVVLLDGAVLLPETSLKEALANLVPALEGDSWLAALQGYFGRMFGPYDPPELRTRVMRELGDAPSHMAAPLFRDLMSSDYADELEASSAPLMYIHARIPADLTRLRALRPDVWLGSVVGSGHYMALAVPNQVNAMLDRFLEVGGG